MSPPGKRRRRQPAAVPRPVPAHAGRRGTPLRTRIAFTLMGLSLAAFVVGGGALVLTYAFPSAVNAEDYEAARRLGGEILSAAWSFGAVVGGIGYLMHRMERP